MTPGYDVIVIGAGSVGMPVAWELARTGLSVGVFDPRPSAGRGENRAAIGGIRATHSEPAKALLCQESIEVFASWKELTGDDIDWRQGGYLFVAHRPEDEEALREVVAVQRGMGLDIDWVDPGRVGELAPGIDPAGLRGGTFSPGDGSASPLRVADSLWAGATGLGVGFHFGEPVTGIRTEGGRVEAVVTPERAYGCDVVVNAAGAAAHEIAAMVGVGLPIEVEGHEAGVTDPVAPFLSPMVVDLRLGEGSKSLYFYQTPTGQLLFCLTPDPPQTGADRRSTSMLHPLLSRRLVTLMPRLRHLRVRRVWRGLYPMTPDGSPLLGWVGADGFLVAAGMCGQGFMLGPGIGRLVGRLITGGAGEGDLSVLRDLDPTRSFVGEELLV
jgi:sarcosine oxidase subunit beta